MGRLSAIFVAVCMTLIAGSVGAVLYLSFGLSGMEAAVITIAALTGLVLVNSINGRARDRTDLGDKIADLSRGTADLARKVSELERRIAKTENDMAASADKVQVATEPLGAEIDELGQLVKELADAVATQESVLANFVAQPALNQPILQHPAIAPLATVQPQPVGPLGATVAASGLAIPIEPSPVEAELAETVQPNLSPSRATSGRFMGMERSEIIALIGRAIEANRTDLYLQPIVTLPQRKVRYYEALTRLRADDGSVLTPDDFLLYAEAAGLMPAIDNLLIFRCVQVVRRLTTKNREVGMFCNMSGSTLLNAQVFNQITDFLEANRTLAPFLVFELSQETVRSMGPVETGALAQLAQLGFRFSLDRVTDLRIEPRELAERGFRFVKVPAALLLNRNAARADIHPEDFSDLLGRYGIDLIGEKIESESTVVDLLDYDVRFGQGYLFSPPRPVRTEVLQGIADRAASTLVVEPAAVVPPPPQAPPQRAGITVRAADSVNPDARAAAERRAGSAQLARGIVRRA